MSSIARSITLTLNRQLRERISQINYNTKQINNIIDNINIDSDYVPSDDCGDDLLNNSCDSDGMNENIEHVIKELLSEIINKIGNEEQELPKRSIYTKKGQIRKRKIYETSVAERKEQKLQAVVNSHEVKTTCTNCRLKCPQKINSNRQEAINKEFWSLSRPEQQLSLMGCMNKISKKRSTTNTYNRNSRRKNSFIYNLKMENGDDVVVCKTFFLSTLGYNANNDCIIKTIRRSMKI